MVPLSAAHVVVAARVSRACLLVLALGAAGCHQPGHALLPVGTACHADRECGTGEAYACAEDHPNGYCVSACRSDADCPAADVCVRDELAQAGACHVRCDQPAQCRVAEGYTCAAASGDASHSFCDPPGSRQLQRRLRAFWWR
jgi:hypothetical protein